MHHDFGQVTILFSRKISRTISREQMSLLAILSPTDKLCDGASFVWLEFRCSPNPGCEFVPLLNYHQPPRARFVHKT